MKKKEYYSIGVMSGTSMDGLDFSLIKTDGKSSIEFINNRYFKFDNKLKKRIKNLIKLFNDDYKLGLHSLHFLSLNKDFSYLIASCIKIFIKENSLDSNLLDVVGIHGTTLLHKPKSKISLQLGDAQLISNYLNIKVIANFRDKDLENDGQGAPLVPIFHNLIFSVNNKNILVINIGGISNYTFLKGRKNFFSSDIGPGNVLIDSFCSEFFNKDFDFNGKLAKLGKVDHKLVNQWKRKGLLKQKHPTSFDNFSFKIEDFMSKELNKSDNLRSLTYLTAILILGVEKKIKSKVDSWIFVGGGIKNQTLMSHLYDLIPPEKIKDARKVGVDTDFVESQAFAYISVRTLKKLKSTFPETTGCKKSSCSGDIFKPAI